MGAQTNIFICSFVGTALLQKKSEAKNLEGKILDHREFKIRFGWPIALAPYGGGWQWVCE